MSIFPYRVSLNWFIKFYSMDAEKQSAEVHRRLQGSGGYDFYRTLSLAICAHIDGLSNDEIEDILSSSQRPAEIHRNKAAYQTYYKRFGRRRGLSKFEKKGIMKLAGGKVEVVSSPLFSHETTASVDIYHLWAAQHPLIDRGRAGIACHILERSFSRQYGNHKFSLFDVNGNRIYSTAGNNAAASINLCAMSLVHWLELYA